MINDFVCDICGGSKYVPILPDREPDRCLQCNGTGRVQLAVQEFKSMSMVLDIKDAGYHMRPLSDDEVQELADYYEVDIDALLEIYHSGANILHKETGSPVKLIPKEG